MGALCTCSLSSGIVCVRMSDSSILYDNNGWNILLVTNNQLLIKHQGWYSLHRNRWYTLRWNKQSKALIKKKELLFNCIPVFLFVVTFSNHENEYMLNVP